MLQPPFAYAEIPMQNIEKILLEKLPRGVAFQNVSFRQIKINRQIVPKLKVALRLVRKGRALHKLRTYFLNFKSGEYMLFLLNKKATMSFTIYLDNAEFS